MLAPISESPTIKGLHYLRFRGIIWSIRALTRTIEVLAGIRENGKQ